MVHQKSYPNPLDAFAHICQLIEANVYLRKLIPIL